MVSLTSIKNPQMVEALQKLQNKLSHRSWQFRWPKWVFRHLLHDWLSAWQTKMPTGSLSVCLSLFSSFLSSLRLQTFAMNATVGVVSALFCSSWMCFGAYLMWILALLLCAGGLRSWFAYLEVEQLVCRRASAPTAGGEDWVMLVKDFASDCWGRGGILHFAPFSYGQQCFGMGWDFAVEQNKVPSPLRDRSFCPQSPSSCDQKDKVCCAQDLVGYGASTYGCKGTVAAKAVALKMWCRQTACLNPRSLGSSTVARSVLPSRELACCPPFRLGL